MSNVKFMVIGLPRSATTWMANWLTTNDSLCLHDPFSNMFPEDLDKYHTAKTLGISCTGAYMYKWFQKQTCPCVIIERNMKDVNHSLLKIGLTKMPVFSIDLFNQAKGKRYSFDSIWKEQSAKEMWNYLLPLFPFDVERYRSLSTMNIQPHFGKWKMNNSITNELLRRGDLCQPVGQPLP